MAFGTTLKQIRKDAQLSQEDVASYLSSRGFQITPQALSHWETGRSQPREYAWDAKFFRALAEALEISEIELLYKLGFNVTLPNDTPAFIIDLAKRLRPLAELPPAQRDDALDRINKALDLAGFPAD